MKGDSQVIRLTDNAKEYLSSIANDDHITLGVKGGGCSGFQYGFSFDKVIDEEDTCITKDGANLVIDSLSLQYLEGSTVDYTEDLMGSKFVITNPNATTTCGCGESFSI